MIINDFAFDLDGTLLNNKGQISPKTIREINEISKKGKRIIFISGRSIPALKIFAKKITRCSPLVLVGLGGSVILDSEKKSVYKSKFFLENEELELVQRAFELELDIKSYSLKNSYFYKEHLSFIDYIKNVLKFLLFKNNFTVSSNYSNKHILKFQIFDSNARVWKNTCPHLNVFNNVNEIEILPPGVSKLIALKALGCTKENTVYFGDSENDIECLSFFTNSVAMLNSDDTIKLSSRYCTKNSNNDDGVADFLGSFNYD